MSQIEEEKMQTPPTKNRKKRIYFYILLPLILMGGLIWFIQERRYVRTNDAQIDGYSIAISSDILARIIELYVDEGDYVKEGQLLCLLDESLILPQKKEAEAQVVHPEAEVVLKQFYLKKVQDDYDRATKAIADRIITAQQFDHAQKDFEIAQTELEVALRNLKLAQAQLEVVEAHLAHTKVYAPKEGVIAKRWVWTGDVMHPGQAMFSLYDLENVWVLANLLESKMESIRLGDSVRIHVDAYPGYTFHGEVFVIKGAAASQFSLIPPNNATGNYTKVEQRIPVKISIRPPEDFPKAAPLYLFPGMSTEVKINVDQR